MVSSAVEKMSLYVVFLKALYLIHEMNHWKVKQNYGNHLMFQRLFEGVQEMVDEAAEKTIGVYGDLVSQDHVDELTKFFNPDGDIESSLKAEKAFQTFATNLYNDLKESGELTLGVDDMIMGHVSSSEVNTYLLQQAEEDMAQ
jgi:DNA-binding ferritin-like protein